MNLTAQQQQLVDQIQALYEQLKLTTPEHLTLQQWFGLESVEAAE